MPDIAARLAALALAIVSRSASDDFMAVSAFFGLCGVGALSSFLGEAGTFAAFPRMVFAFFGLRGAEKTLAAGTASGCLSSEVDGFLYRPMMEFRGFKLLVFGRVFPLGEAAGSSTGETSK